MAQPARYARFLGLELSLAYKQRLLVVMPNGFGFNWPGHSTAAAYRLLGEHPDRARRRRLAHAAESAVRKLAAAGGDQARYADAWRQDAGSAEWGSDQRRRIADSWTGD